MNILIVDDSKPIRCMLVNVLSGVGHVVTVACDGKEGTAMAENFKFDLVITDVNMPEMDGFEFARHLRYETEHKFTPIVFLTTESSDEFRAKGRKAGATAWITKPFSPKKLLEVVAKFAK
jgi:two-component system, chemotaxis family, chemotaxis protein CheY